jgi:protein ImuB
MIIELEDFGITTIESLLKIPPKSITKRFGRLLLERLNSLNQTTEEVIETVTPSPTRITGFVFDPPTQDMHTVRHAIRDRYNYLLSSVCREQKSIRGILFEVRTASDSFFKSITTYSHQSAEQLCDILEPFLLSNDYNDGVTHLFIKITDIEDTSFFQDELFNPKKTYSDDLESKFLSLMSNKLDTTQINISHLENYHLPELEISFTSIIKKTAHSGDSYPDLDPRHTRPSIFYPRSKPITVTLSAETAQPNLIKYRKTTLTIIRSVGPENIEYPWFLGAVSHCRSYYSVQDTLGRWYWIYNNSKNSAWYLSGIFA